MLWGLLKGIIWCDFAWWLVFEAWLIIIGGVPCIGIHTPRFGIRDSSGWWQACHIIIFIVHTSVLYIWYHMEYTWTLYYVFSSTCEGCLPSWPLFSHVRVTLMYYWATSFFYSHMWTLWDISSLTCASRCFYKGQTWHFDLVHLWSFHKLLEGVHFLSPPLTHVDRVCYTSLWVC